MKIEGFTRLKREDFNSENNQLIDKLAFILNPALDQIERALNKNLDFNNFLQEVKEIVLIVDANGNPTTQTQVKNNLFNKIRGTTVIKAENITNINTYPTAQPFITYNENNKILTINNVSGLQANNKYKLTVITYG